VRGQLRGVGCFKLGIKGQESRRYKDHVRAGGEFVADVPFRKLRDAFEAEQSILESLKEYRVRAKNSRLHGGHTECLSLDAPVVDMLNQLKVVSS